jgi:predicted secreted protein
VALIAPITLAVITGWQFASPSEFNQPGNILISDQYNNRVIEVDRNGNILWQFGDEGVNPGPTSVVGPNDAERVGTQTLISGTGVPAGAEPQCPNGCADNRVLLVNGDGSIAWQYGQAGVTGSGPNQLSAPVCAVYLPNTDILITDQGNNRIIEVNQSKQIVWRYPAPTTGNLNGSLNSPNSAELLANGHILISDESNNRVIEVNRAGATVWQYAPNNLAALNGPAFASRLTNGNTVISDSLNNRIIEIDPNGMFLGAYVTSKRPGSVPNPIPTRGLKLMNGDLLVSDQYNHQVFQVDSVGANIFEYGQIGVAGNGPNQLNGPYDAKQIGDYTGITPPTGF